MTINWESIMRYLEQFQINILSIAILLVLFIIMRSRSKIESFGKNLLLTIMITSAVAIIVEPLTWIFDGESFFRIHNQHCFIHAFTDFGRIDDFLC